MNEKYRKTRMDSEILKQEREILPEMFRDVEKIIFNMGPEKLEI